MNQTSTLKTIRNRTATFLGAALLICASGMPLHGQTTSDFNEIKLDEESYWNGSDESGGFKSGNIFFPNYFTWWDEDTYSWSGFTVSNVTDNETPGYGNHYSAFTGEPYKDNLNYAVVYVSDPSTYENSMFLYPDENAEGGYFREIVVTNNTYAAIAMRDGDDFSKQFGGEDGDDPDWFLLTIIAWHDGDSTGETEFYLADYRFEDNEKDYIVDGWEALSLEELGPVDSLELRLSSSDMGDYGMNTPAYFCIGEITTWDDNDPTPVAAIEHDQQPLIYPNPVRDRADIRIPGNQRNELVDLRIMDMAGRLVHTTKISQGSSVDLSSLPDGIYVAIMEGKNFHHSQRILKR
ncbi:MAG: DUF4465 domain-containing protein [Bacteroidales bacterium]